MEFTVLTYNIHKGLTWNNSQPILYDLKVQMQAYDPDLVFLQEVVGAHQKNRSRFETWFEPQLEFLADGVWSEFAYAQNAVYPDGNHGNALLSRNPILSWVNTDISTNRFEKRGLLKAVVQLPEVTKELHAFCVHLNIFPWGKKHQLRILEEQITQLPPDSPVIVAGDFNSWHGMVGDFLEQDLQLRDAIRETRGAAQRSFPAAFPLLALDRIYIRNLEVINVVEWPDPKVKWLSDHLPLAVKLRISP